MTSVSSCEFIARVKEYVKANWGSPFIAGFILLLIGTAIFLSTGLSSWADTVAAYAYYALVVGVVLQLISYLKYRKEAIEAEYT